MLRLLGCVAILGAGAALAADAPDAGCVYSCPMHPLVQSNEPGECPQCGMTLVPMDMHAHPHHPAMDAMVDPLGFGMSREGSGTAWQPDATPVYGHHFVAGSWMLMFHYNVAAGLDLQTGARGDTQFMSTNWAMLMAQHLLAAGQFTTRAMLSLEPLTTGGPAGYPLLLQTGETAGGVPLHDRQHPHDLFMEVAAKYNHAITQDLAFELYAAPSGEPALGPVAFPHRLSAMPDPLAAIGHHWEDSSHVSFGVVTGGLYTRTVKLEASWFNGREPDENRYDFDLHAPDSWSARASFNPTSAWSFQASFGYLKSPEALDPGQDVRRITASATYDRPVGSGNWATTAVFGRNVPTEEAASNALLVESNLDLGANVVFGRAEAVQKSGRDLVLPADQASQLYWVGLFSLGYLRQLAPIGGLVPGIGVRAAVNFVGGPLAGVYGSSTPVGAILFLHLRPDRML